MPYVNLVESIHIEVEQAWPVADIKSWSLEDSKWIPYGLIGKLSNFYLPWYLTYALYQATE